MRLGLFLRTIASSVVRFVARQSAGRLFVIAISIALSVLTFSIAIAALNSALLFDGFAANGAFQLMNPLRRLAAGEFIGHDFNFFHGVGVPLLHVPFYYLFGQGLFGSEIARWIVSPSVFLLSAFCFFYVFKKRFLFALTAAVATTVLAMHIMPFLVLPLTSLLGVRSVVPVLLLAVMLKQASLKRSLLPRHPLLKHISLYEVLVSVLLALGLVCGTEFGVAAILGFFIASTLYATEASSLRERLYSSIRVVGLLAVATLVFLTIITGGTPLQPLRFALNEIPVDQFWYFGVPPNNFLHSGNIVTVILHDGRLLVMLAMALIASILVYRVHCLRTERVACQAFIYGLLAGAFAMVSMLGYFHNSEASALARMALLVGIASVVLLVGRWRKPVRFSLEWGRRKQRLRFTPDHALRLLGAAFIVFAIVSGVCFIKDTKKEYDIYGTLAKTKRYALGQDRNLLGPVWHGVDEAVMPIIQHDNTIEIANVTDGQYDHGVSRSVPEAIVLPGKHSEFVRPGQLVYFAKAGRQIIKSVQPRENGQLTIRLESTAPRLDPKFDGAPAKLIIAEDFDRNDRKVWLLYSGLLEAEMKTFNPTPQGYDYIIHALGPERRTEYVQDFKTQKPEFVLTLSKPYFRYEEWVQNAHWDFYSLLDQNYEVVKETAIYVVWKKREQPWSDTHRQGQWQRMTVDKQAKEIRLPNLDFTNVADLEAYGIATQKAEYERLRALGKPVKEEKRIDEDAYDKFKVTEERAARNYETWRRENSGPEANAREHAAWLESVKTGKSEFAIDQERPEGKLHIARPKRQVILIRLRYNVHHPLSSVPLIGKTTRYFVEPNNVYSSTPISLRPYAHEIIFPVVVSEMNKDPYLRLNTYSMLPGKGVLDVTSAEWTVLDTSTANLKALTD